MIECPLCKENGILNSFLGCSTDVNDLSRHLFKGHFKILLAKYLAELLEEGNKNETL